MNKEKDWDLIISPKKSAFDLNLKEVLSFKDLILLFVKRDFIAFYKQTILGPFWFFIQPLLTAGTFTFLMEIIKGGDLSSGAVLFQRFLFMLAGIVGWSYFQECLVKTANTFNEHKDLFGKVYFPRIVMPLSVVLSNILKYGVQFTFFLIVLFVYHFTFKSISFNYTILLLPVLLLVMAMTGLGLGLLISALTTKYRDFQFLVRFGIQLLMYFSPVLWRYDENSPLKFLMDINPMTGIIEVFRHGFLGSENGQFNTGLLLYSFVFSVVVFVIGYLVFNKTEKSFMDTV